MAGKRVKALVDRFTTELTEAILEDLSEAMRPARRGRPRKNAASTDAAAAPAPRKRGRPPKSASGVAGAAPGNRKPRPRGRPRKSAAEATSAPQDADPDPVDDTEDARERQGVGAAMARHRRVMKGLTSHDIEEAFPDDNDEDPENHDYYSSSQTGTVEDIDYFGEDDGGPVLADTVSSKSLI